MNRQRITVAAVAAGLAAASAAGLIANSAQAQSAGELFQKKCMSCHSPTATVPANLKGPVLNGIVGKKIASSKGYEYSAGLKGKTGNWTEANLDAFLASPKTFAPGTKMIPSTADPAQRKQLIEHMKTLK